MSALCIAPRAIRPARVYFSTPKISSTTPTALAMMKTV